MSKRVLPERLVLWGNLLIEKLLPDGVRIPTDRVGASVAIAGFGVSRFITLLDVMRKPSVRAGEEVQGNRLCRHGGGSPLVLMVLPAH